MTLLEWLDPQRIGALYDRLGAKPLTGRYRKVHHGQLYCCPLAALAIEEDGPEISVFAIDTFLQRFPGREVTAFIFGYEGIEYSGETSALPYYRRGQELARYLGGRSIPALDGHDPPFS